MPAEAGAIVVSTGMLTLLDAQERRALLAHEAAHLRHHHARYVAVAELAVAANPLLRPLARGVRLAVELWADQVAAQEVGDSRAVARALARASLAASGRGTGNGREPRRWCRRQPGHRASQMCASGCTRWSIGRRASTAGRSSSRRR